MVTSSLARMTGFELLDHSAVKHCAVQIVHWYTMLIYEILMVQNIFKIGPDIIKQTTARVNLKKLLSGKIQHPQVIKLGKKLGSKFFFDYFGRNVFGQILVK